MRTNLFWGVLIAAAALVSCSKSSLTPFPETLDGESQKLSALNTGPGSVTAEKPILLGYYGSWGEGWLNDDGRSTFTTLPATITHVFFAFAKPNLTYVKGSYDITRAKTGLECYSTPEPRTGGLMLKRAVSILKQRGIKVILSIGGDAYWNTPESYTNINYQQIKDLVDDIGFAGIDWDFEPDGGFSNAGSALNVNRLSTYIRESRQLMPKSEGYIISTAPAGVGALGGSTNNDPASPFAYANRNTLTGESDSDLYNFTDPTKSIGLFGMSATGSMIPVLKAVGNLLDIVAYQAYNTGAAPNRTLMYNSYAYYANLYGFRLAHGTHVPNEPWGPHYEYTPQKVADLAEYIRNGGSQNRQGKNDGIMIWNLTKDSAKGTNYKGITYLNMASKVLNGASKETALANAFDYVGVVVEIPDVGPVDPNPGTGPGGCGFPAYDPTRTYPTPGTKVFYNGKIYQNKWWVNTNQAPESEQWGPWEFVQNCSSN